MADLLKQYLRDASRRAFMLGTWDCGRYVARWVLLRRGVEPGLAFVGRYSTALGLARLVKRRGGMAAHFGACLDEIGVPPTGTPARGDVAIVDAPEGETGAIMLSATLSACLSRNGIRMRTLPVIQAWSVGA